MSSKNMENSVTVMVVPHGDEDLITFKLPFKYLRAIGVLLIVLLIGSVSMVYSYKQTRARLINYNQLLTTSRTQQENILFLAKMTTDLQGQLGSLQDLDSSIRRMMKLEESRYNPITSLAASTLGTESRLQLTSRSSSLAATILKTQQNIEIIQHSIPDAGENLKDLEQRVQFQKDKEAATPSIWPTRGNITSSYGYRLSPLGYSREFHSGVDIGSSKGTSVFAGANGTVRVATYNGGYGNV
ncbi:MAG: hypothetical protein Q8N36_02960, partial [bacterium]|nr:hypothetical protein [bacterium]